MLNLERLQPEEAERLAYAEGFTGVAKLYARIAELEHAGQTLLNMLDHHARHSLGDEIDTAIGELREVLR